MNQNRKKDRKPIYLLLVLFLIFGGFICLLMCSHKDPFIIKIESSMTSKEVKIVWVEIKATKPLKAQMTTLLKVLRKKLVSLKLSSEETNEWIEELTPYSPLNLNIIVIPDLSERIISSPSQIKSDIQIINEIWNVFKKYSRLKQDCKSRLIIEVADDKPKIANVVNQLRFDLSNHKGAGISFFTVNKDSVLKDNVKKLYRSAKEEPFASDYVLYFKKNLESHLKKSTLFDIYVNKVIIITNGYIKGDKKVYTVIDSYRYQLFLAMKAGNLLETIHNNNLNIPPAGVDLSNTEIMICEVDEVTDGKGFDFEILKVYWEDWLNKMNAKKIIFDSKKNAIQSTIDNIENFILH